MELRKTLPSLYFAEVLVSDVSVTFAAESLAKRIVWLEVWGLNPSSESF